MAALAGFSLICFANASPWKNSAATSVSEKVNGHPIPSCPEIGTLYPRAVHLIYPDLAIFSQNFAQAHEVSMDSPGWQSKHAALNAGGRGERYEKDRRDEPDATNP